MPSYFKNLSTFRVFLLCLLVVSAGISLFGHFFGNGGDDVGSRDDTRLHEALTGCGDDFGKRLLTQETLAVDVAIRYEALDDKQDAERIGRILNEALDGTSRYIMGAGISLFGTAGEQRQVLYVAKNRQQTGDDLNTALRELRDTGGLTAREININRKMDWALISSPPTDAGPRFFILLTVSLGGFEVNAGVALVKAEFDWAADILKRAERAGAKKALCVSPDGDVLWLEKGRLVYDRDFVDDANGSRRRLVAWARQSAARPVAADDPDVAKSEVLGTGWTLLAARVDDAPETGRLPGSVIIMLVAGCIIVLDMVISTLSIHSRSNIESVRGMSSASGEKAGRAGLLGSAYNLLFRYRMINPEQERLESELRIARKIQFSLVPDSFPAYSEWREFDLYSILSPAREVGGDYYDFFMLDSNRIVLAVGDVSGKGFPAALYMAVCRTAFRTLARDSANPGELLTRLNDLLVRDNKSGFYITMAAFMIDLAKGDCEYALAAHPAPLWNEKSADRTVFVDSPRETFIGMKAGLYYPLGSFRMSPGDTLLLYTDGVTEARNQNRDELEYEGLKELFLANRGASNCRELLENMERSLHKFVGTSEQQDDMTVLAFRYWGPGGQKLLRKKERKAAGSKTDAAKT